MSSHRTRKHLSHRYVRLLLEELEGRYVPSLMGVQIELPLPALLSPVSLSVGIGTAPTAAPTTSTLTITTTSTPTSTTISISEMTTPASTTTSPVPGTVSFSYTPPAAGSNLSSAPTTGSTSGASQPPASASSTGGTSASSFGSASAIPEGASQGSSTFAVPGGAVIAFAPGLGIQAALAGSSTALGETFSGVNFELLGNLPTLLGPANIQPGTANAASATSSAGTPWSGSALNRLTDRTTGEAAARGLTAPAPGDREEPLPDQLLIPPDQDWFEPVPHTIEHLLPSGNALLRTQADFPAVFLTIAPQQPDTVDAQFRDAPLAELPDGVLLDDEAIGIPADEEQPEEQSGMTAAVAIFSGAAGAYWTTRRRSLRKIAVGLSEIDEEM
jgi:hypothetical protein